MKVMKNYVFSSKNQVNSYFLVVYYRHIIPEKHLREFDQNQSISSSFLGNKCFGNLIDIGLCQNFFCMSDGYLSRKKYCYSEKYLS